VKPKLELKAKAKADKAVVEEEVEEVLPAVGAEEVPQPYRGDTSDSSISSTGAHVDAKTSCRVALDYHGVLDLKTKGGQACLSTVEAVRKLLASGFTVWVLSYIGRQGPDSDSRRAACESLCRGLARQCGLKYPASCIGPKNLYVHITDVRLYDSRSGKEGKAGILREKATRIIIDDRAEVAVECEAYGILTYQVLPSSRRNKHRVYYPQCPELHDHLPAEDLDGAVEALLADDRSSVAGRIKLDRKVRALECDARW